MEKRKKVLDIFPYGNVMWLMARAATTSDAFNAVAEPRRRAILNYLALQERPVGEIVDSLGLEQPSVSKHLRVLLEVGLVNVRRDGRRKFYRTNAEAIRPLHEWTETFERYWRHQLSRVKERAEQKSNPSNNAGVDFSSRRKNDLDSNKN
jgi:DNA-binding transcriptional ArsR family regulator